MTISSNKALLNLSDGSEKTVASVLGEIVWLMSQSSKFKGTPIGDLETLIMPAILLRQFRIIYNNNTPIASIIYALASDEGEDRIRSRNLPLAIDDWKTGNKIVVILTIAPFGGEEEIKSQFENETNTES